jgi:hypothetical protein
MGVQEAIVIAMITAVPVEIPVVILVFNFETNL